MSKNHICFINPKHVFAFNFNILIKILLWKFIYSLFQVSVISCDRADGRERVFALFCFFQKPSITFFLVVLPLNTRRMFSPSLPLWLLCVFLSTLACVWVLDGETAQEARPTMTSPPLCSSSHLEPLKFQKRESMNHLGTSASPARRQKSAEKRRALEGGLLDRTRVWITGESVSTPPLDTP